MKQEDWIKTMENRTCEYCETPLDGYEEDYECCDEKVIENLIKILKKLYTPAKIAVNQIICMGGAEYCQPCQNREELAIVLEEVEKLLKEYGKDTE